LTFWIEETSLKGKVVALEPLNHSHSSEIQKAASDGELWDLWYTGVPSPAELEEHIKLALKEKQQNGDLPFIVRHLQSNKVIGATRYCHVDNHNKRLEIGYTWYAKSFQRTAVNTECKLLLLTHAFEKLNAIAVEFRTHWMNQQSRQAIVRIGAKQDGILRNHQRLADGSYRDTVVFSILNSEWLSIKNHLTAKLKL